MAWVRAGVEVDASPRPAFWLYLLHGNVKNNGKTKKGHGPLQAATRLWPSGCRQSFAKARCLVQTSAREPPDRKPSGCCSSEP